MAIEVRLEVSSTDLLYQQNPPAKVTVTNVGREPVTVANLADTAVPTFRLVALDTGAESEQRGPFGMTGIAYRPLPPRASVEEEFPLFEHFHLPGPGRYELSAMVETEGGEQVAESAPLLLDVRGAAPKGLSLASASGGASALLYGATVNTRATPPEVVRYVMTNGGVLDATVVAPAHSRAAPVVSSPRNGKVEHSHWVAWIEGSSLVSKHVDAMRPDMKPRSVDIGVGGAEIIAVSIQPNPDHRVRPRGQALVLAKAPMGPQFFRMIDLDERGGTAGPAEAIRHGETHWAASLERGNGERPILSAHTADDGVALHVQPWSGHRLTGNAPGDRLVHWPGVSFVGSAATMTLADEILGGTLVRHDGQPDLEMITWTFAKDGTFREDKRTPVTWGDAQGIVDCRVAVGPKGVAAALIRDDEKTWHTFDGQAAVSPAPGNLESTDLTLTMAFFRPGVPMLVAASEHGGLRVLTLDGHPLSGGCG